MSLDKQIIELQNTALNEVSQKPDLVDNMKSIVGKPIKMLGVGLISMGLLMGSGLTNEAKAEMSLGCVLGAVAGGLLGNQVGKGTGNTVATAGGAVAGCEVGQALEKPNVPQGMPGQVGYGQPGKISIAPQTDAQLRGLTAPVRANDAIENQALTKEAIGLVRNAEAYNRAQIEYQRNADEFAKLQNSAVARSVYGNNAYQVENKLNQSAQQLQGVSQQFSRATIAYLQVSEEVASTGGSVVPNGFTADQILKAVSGAPLQAMQNNTQQRSYNNNNYNNGYNNNSGGYGYGNSSGGYGYNDYQQPRRGFSR